ASDPREGVRAPDRASGARALAAGRGGGACSQSARTQRRHGRSPDRRLAAAMVTLDRGMGLLQATATNIIGMVGVGPFLTIPFMVAAMHGPHIIYAWAYGAELALCDGMVYAVIDAAISGS